MAYKNLVDVEEKLNGALALPVSQRQGAGGMTFDYVAWTDSYRLLNDIFGIFGWTMSQPVVIFADGVYTVSLAITVRVVQPQTTLNGTYDQVIEKTVSGIGQAVSRGSNDDNAAKSALSDALSRAVKMLGSAFGIELYEKKSNVSSFRRDTATNTTSTAPRGNGQPIVIKNDGPVTQPQLNKIKALGFTGETDNLTKRSASALIEQLMSTQPEPVF